MDLSVDSIDRAIKELEKYKQDLNKKVSLLVQALTDRGVEIAKAQVVEVDPSAFYTGALEESITGYYSPSTNVGIIKTDLHYAVFVEFGTGVVGSRNSHPKAGELGYRYDVNEHGDEGWWYYNDRDQKWHWTKGFKSRPFMYNTVLQLERECTNIAREVFNRG